MSKGQEQEVSVQCTIPGCGKIITGKGEELVKAMARHSWAHPLRIANFTSQIDQSLAKCK